jgi:RNA polymerase sigma-70 factor (ECF subfamily)
MTELEVPHPARAGVDCHDAPQAVANDRLRALLNAHYAFIWRQLRRLGLSSDGAEDATQRVFVIVSRRIDDIEPGRERSFIFGIARRVASDARRSANAKRESVVAEVPETTDTSPGADELIDRQRARALLDEALDAMDDDLRAVFVLFELEELSVMEIAEMLELPTGTAASRLRRAREEFKDVVKRLSARRRSRGARP